ncbi:MAG: hypothetical protein MRK02_06480 [Candidatus Scalindua sp.]|nr:hypothetical protein [Candidatus Scalindua sp.]
MGSYHDYVNTIRKEMMGKQRSCLEDYVVTEANQGGNVGREYRKLIELYQAESNCRRDKVWNDFTEAISLANWVPERKFMNRRRRRC